MALLERITKQTGFALRLAHQASSTTGQSTNLVLSPVALHAILGLIAAGSRGHTRDQVLRLVDAADPEELRALASQTTAVVLADASVSGGPRIAFANGVWVDSSVQLKQVFAETVSDDYKGESKPVNFKAQADEVRNEVNSWVENSTAGLIKDLLPPGSVNSESMLILSNALYFKGEWEKKFDVSQTEDSEFYMIDGSSVKVPFMTSKDKQYISSQDGFKVLRLPYKQGGDFRQFSMYVFLPDSRDGVWSMLKQLTSDFRLLDNFLPKQKLPVGKFKIPRFKVSSSFEASEDFKGLGLVLPFSPEADLSDMVDSPSTPVLYISAIVHKAIIDVNEEGTEAAAASATVMFGSSSLMVQNHIDFVADHPFFYLLREDKTGMVVFAGQVLNPSLP